MKKINMIISVILLVFAVAFAGCDLAPQSSDYQVGEPTVVKLDKDYDGILIKFKDNAILGVEQKFDPSFEKYGRVESKAVMSDFNIAVAKISDDANLQEVLDYYNSLPGVEYAEPNYIYYIAAPAPNDPYYTYQWHMSQLNATTAWDTSTGSGAKVAVVDTGVAYNLSDLANTSFDLANDYDFVNNDNDAYDDNSHGTHVTGTIAQSTYNGTGTVGLAYNATILPVKVLAASGSGTLDGVANGIRWAADKGANVINMSLGGGGSTALQSAVDYAYNKGVTIFAASGNERRSTVSYPAAYTNCIAVGATRYDKARARYSNYGSALDIVAPGGDTSVDQNKDGYVDGVLQQTITGYNSTTGTTDYTPGYFFYQGTSMATPHAAALGALLKAAKPSATPAQVRAAVQNSATDLGTAGWDKYFGYGLINPVAALNYILTH